MKSIVIVLLFVAAGWWLARWTYYRLARACAEDYADELSGGYSDATKRDPG